MPVFGSVSHKTNAAWTSGLGPMVEKLWIHARQTSQALRQMNKCSSRWSSAPRAKHSSGPGQWMIYLWCRIRQETQRLSTECNWTVLSLLPWRYNVRFASIKKRTVKFWKSTQFKQNFEKRSLSLQCKDRPNSKKSAGRTGSISAGTTVVVSLCGFVREFPLDEQNVTNLSLHDLPSCSVIL